MTEDDWDFFNRSVGKLEKEVITLKKENTQLKTEYEKECHRADELEDSYWKAEKENQKLKELLKEVNDYLPEFETPMNILAKIDEVLK